MTRKFFNDGQEITYEDLNSLSALIQQGLFDSLIYEMVGRKENAFFGDSFTVTRVSNTQVTVKKGYGFQTDATVASTEPQKRPLYRSADVTQNLDPADGANPRIDILCVKHNLVDGLSGSRKYKDPGTLAITLENFVLSKNWEAEVNYVVGTPAGSPVAPATPSGYVKISELYITAAVGLANQAGVTDSRSTMSAGSQDKEYDAVVGSVSQAGVTHATLKAALDAASAGWKILVLENETINAGAIPDAALDNIEIVFKPKVTFLKGTATKGLILSGDGCKVRYGRFQDFSTGGDRAVEVTGEYNTVEGTRFKNCATNVFDGSTNGINQYGTITEV